MAFTSLSFRGEKATWGSLHFLRALLYYLPISFLRSSSAVRLASAGGDFEVIITFPVNTEKLFESVFLLGVGESKDG